MLRKKPAKHRRERRYKPAKPLAGELDDDRPEIDLDADNTGSTNTESQSGQEQN